MAFDIEMIKTVYASFAKKVEAARKVLNKPLTLTEKILYAHLDGGNITKEFQRGKDYVDFNPDRVCMQDATAQMALLQFMQAGRKKVAVPSTVHCDHLIQAEIGAQADLEKAKNKTKKCMIFSLPFPTNTASDFGNPARELFTRLYWNNMHFPAE